MKHYLLTLVLLFSAILPSPADASGSNTVFLPVRLTDYKFTMAMNDSYFKTSELFDYLESSQNKQILVARVDAYVYRTTYYYTYWGYDMSLGFQDYESVIFRLYPRLNAIIGVTSDGNIVVLLPEVAKAPDFSTGHLLGAG